MSLSCPAEFVAIIIGHSKVFGTVGSDKSESIHSCVKDRGRGRERERERHRYRDTTDKQI